MTKLSSSSSAFYSHHLGSLPLWLLSAALKAAKMKGKASGFLKQVLSLLISAVKYSKSAAVKSKTSAVKTRLIFGLLHHKKALMSAVSNKIDTLMGQEKESRTTTAHHGSNLAIVEYSEVGNEAPPECIKMVQYGGGEIMEEKEEEDCYPDLRHSLFDEDDAEFGGSVIDLVKNSRGQNQGEFVLEDEIDRVAELFIARFHRQMRMQRLESFKRHQLDRLERSVQLRTEEEIGDYHWR